MGLARLLPRTELLVVTTPPVAAQKVAARAADMARRGYLRVAGRDREHERLHLRARHHLRALRLGRRRAPGPRARASRWSGSIPLHPDLAAGGDAGVPVALGGSSELAAVFEEMARVVAEEVAPLVDAQGCSARLIERVEAAVAQGGRRDRLRTAPAATGLAVTRRPPSGSRWCPRPPAHDEGRPALLGPSARRWAHSEKRATGQLAAR